MIRDTRLMDDGVDDAGCAPQRSPMKRTLSSPYNLFMSHAWGEDLRGRSTHDRVRALQRRLRDYGWKCWFDEERLLLGDHLDVKMASGIAGSDAVCVCLTKRYIEKVNAHSARDNVFKEWNFAQAINKRVLPLVFESEMLDCKAWPPGVMSLYLGNTFYIDCTGDDVGEIAGRLNKMLLLLGMQPRLSKTYSWPLRTRSRGMMLMPRSRSTVRL